MDLLLRQALLDQGHLVAMSVGGGGLPAIPAVQPGSIEELRESNAIMRAKFEAMVADLGSYGCTIQGKLMKQLHTFS